MRKFFTATRQGKWVGTRSSFAMIGVFAAAGLAPTISAANPSAIAAFANHCFSPFLTAETAAERLGVPGARIAFYDLDPFSGVAPSPGTNVRAGTDRRCEVAFDGDLAQDGAAATLAALEREGIRAEAPLPDDYTATPETALLGARYLNPNRIAVVIVGTRPGPNGIETFLTVERQTPLNRRT